MKAGPHREVFGVDRDDFAFQYPPLLDFWTSWRIVDLSREGALISKPVRVVGRKLILILAHLRQAGKLVEARAMFQEVTRESEIPLDFFGSLSEQILAQGEVATHVGFQRPFGWNDLDGPIGAGGSPFFFLDRIVHVDVPVDLGSTHSGGIAIAALGGPLSVLPHTAGVEADHEPNG